MKESPRKDRASHPDPESCVGVGNATGEALTGAHARQPSSCEIPQSGTPMLSSEAEGNTGSSARASSDPGPAQSKTLRMRGNSLHGNREVPSLARCGNHNGPVEESQRLYARHARCREARHERTLEAVACSALFGPDSASEVQPTGASAFDSLSSGVMASSAPVVDDETVGTIVARLVGPLHGHPFQKCPEATLKHHPIGVVACGVDPCDQLFNAACTCQGFAGREQVVKGLRGAGPGRTAPNLT